MKGVKGDDGSGKAPQRAETGTEAEGKQSTDVRGSHGSPDVHPLDSRFWDIKIASPAAATALGPLRKVTVVIVTQKGSKNNERSFRKSFRTE